jgi:hypothetical protein
MGDEDIDSKRFIELTAILDKEEEMNKASPPIENGETGTEGLATPSNDARVGFANDTVIDNIAYVRLMLTSISLFSLTQQASSCIAAATHLYTFITDKWYDPIIFSLEYKGLKKCLCTATSALVSILEASSGIIYIYIYINTIYFLNL